MLLINIDNFELSNKNEILNENGELQFWSQPDFAYKQRVHVYDCLNNEIGYIQFKILSIQDGTSFFDYLDKQIDMSCFKQVNKLSKWNYDIEYNESIVARIREGQIEITNNCDIGKCILFIISKAEQGE